MLDDAGKVVKTHASALESGNHDRRTWANSAAAGAAGHRRAAQASIDRVSDGGAVGRSWPIVVAGDGVTGCLPGNQRGHGIRFGDAEIGSDWNRNRRLGSIVRVRWVAHPVRKCWLLHWAARYARSG